MEVVWPNSCELLMEVVWPNSRELLMEVVWQNSHERTTGGVSGSRTETARQVDFLQLLSEEKRPEQIARAILIHIELVQPWGSRKNNLQNSNRFMSS
jgi:hypothetical protein